MSKSTTPYTYRIGWSASNLFYYGVRFAKGCEPKELWIKYKTSSKYVKEAFERLGDPDIIEVRKVFQCSDSARDWEHKVLRRLGAKDRDDYLNQTDNKSISREACARAREAMIATKNTEEWKATTGKESARKRMAVQDFTATGKAISKTKQSQEWQETKKPAMIKKFLASMDYSIVSRKVKLTTSDPVWKETVKKQQNENSSKLQNSQQWKDKHFKECSHCGKGPMSPGNFNRWHGDKCKEISL